MHNIASPWAPVGAKNYNRQFVQEYKAAKMLAHKESKGKFVKYKIVTVMAYDYYWEVKTCIL